MNCDIIQGIGKILSQRIIEYREALGGFATLAQLQEIKGLHLTLQQRITKRYHIVRPPKLLQINLLMDSRLCLHAYIDSALCEDIRSLRPFHSIEDFQTQLGLSDSLVDKLKPYLSF